MKKERVAITIGVVAATVLAVLFLPLPFSVKCTFEVQARGAQQVYTSQAGQVAEVFVEPGQRVEAGQPILRLESPDLEYEVTELDGRRQESAQVVKVLNDSRFHDPAAIDQLQVALELRDTAQNQYNQKKQELDRLTIKAPIAGTVLPPMPKLAKEAQAKGQIRSWVGSPFDKKNVGALITPTDLICQVGDPENMEAVLVIDQTYIDLVRDGNQVKMLLESNTHQAHWSQIERIAATDLQAVSRAASTQAGGRLETKTDPSGRIVPLSTSYQAMAPLGNSAGKLQVGMQGQARVYTGWQPLGRRLYRFVTKTFHFDL